MRHVLASHCDVTDAKCTFKIDKRSRFAIGYKDFYTRLVLEELVAQHDAVGKNGRAVIATPPNDGSGCRVKSEWETENTGCRNDKIVRIDFEAAARAICAQAPREAAHARAFFECSNTNIVEFNRNIELRHVGIEVAECDLEIANHATWVELAQHSTLLLVEPWDSDSGIREVQIGGLHIDHNDLAFVIGASLESKRCLWPLTCGRCGLEFVRSNEPAVLIAKKLEPASQGQVGKCRD